MTTVFYDLSGGMESAAMCYLDRNRCADRGGIVRWADTGKQFPEMEANLRQIEGLLRLPVVRVPQRITFDEFLFERGGMIRKGTTDCSRRMKRANLSRHMKTFDRPYEVNIGFNADERDRADEFQDRNEREWLHWRFPLIEHGVTRSMTRELCQDAGFTVLLDVYDRMGRFDCYWCGNQTPAQALKVADQYPELAREWMEAEERKGHSFLPIPLKVLIERRDDPGPLFRESACACFGGTDAFDDEDES